MMGRPNPGPINFTMLLKQVNALRNAVDGMEPLPGIPKGEVLESSDCPIARALSNGVRAEVDWDEIIFTYPRTTTEDELKAAVERIKKAGFKMHNDEDGNIFTLRRFAKQIRVQPTKTMANFIIKFDVEDLTEYIEGWEGSY